MHIKEIIVCPIYLHGPSVNQSVATLPLSTQAPLFSIISQRQGMWHSSDLAKSVF